MKYMVTRSSYCPHCAKAGKPAKDDLYAVFGTLHQSFHLGLADSDTPYSKQGYTPHLFEKIAVQSLDSGVHIHVLKTCLMHDCGVFIAGYKISNAEVLWKGQVQEQDVLKTLYIYRKRWRKILMPEKDWNALVKFTDSGYEIGGYKND